jgi:hypothetical protein
MSGHRERRIDDDPALLGGAGYCNERGQPFNPQSVRAMIEGPQARPRRPSYPD